MSTESMSLNKQELTELFRKLGAQDPEGWARSQVEGGIPQLPRYLFPHQPWRDIVEPGDRSDDPGDVEPEVSDPWWTLFLVDENGTPIVPVDALIESVLETDPTGREMRPPGATP